MNSGERRGRSAGVSPTSEVVGVCGGSVSPAQSARVKIVVLGEKIVEYLAFDVSGASKAGGSGCRGGLKETNVVYAVQKRVLL